MLKSGWHRIALPIHAVNAAAAAAMPCATASAIRKETARAPLRIASLLSRDALASSDGDGNGEGDAHGRSVLAHIAHWAETEEGRGYGCGPSPRRLEKRWGICAT